MAKNTTPKDPDEITPRKTSTPASKILSFVLLGMLVVGLGGFGVSNFGQQVDTVITVGKAQVSTSQYYRALKGQIDQFSQQFGTQFTFAQAQMFGLDAQTLQSLISNAALDNEAIRLGLSAGDVQVAQRIATTKAFLNVSGTFDRTTYAQVLEQNGLTVKDFEAGLRDDLARQLLQAAVVGGMNTPQALTDTLYAYQAETRAFTVLQLSQNSLPEKLAEPTEPDLQTFYTAHIADFTRPEAKRVAYALLKPSDLAKDQTVAEADIKAAYDAAFDTFNIPEKRLVERLVYPSEDEAKAAKAQFDAGTSFEDLVKARGLTLGDIDMGDVSLVDLGEAGQDVFALTEPGVVGPLPSNLGPALYRMNTILPAQITPFDQAQDTIKGDLQLAMATKTIVDKFEPINDLLAGGATIVEVAKDQAMTEGTTDYSKDADDNDAVTQDAEFAKAVEAMEPGDFAQVVSLSDGSVMVLQVTETVPPTPVPFEKAREKITAAYQAEALAKALTALAESHLAAAKSGTRLETLGITDNVASATRSTKLPAVPADVLAAAFTLKPEDVVKIDANGIVALVRLDAIKPADMASEGSKADIEALSQQTAQSIAQDAYELFSTAMTTQGGLTIDQAAITAVQARMN
jgi:peptidyl-prolyl cis-trans isomerase D